MLYDTVLEQCCVLMVSNVARAPGVDRRQGQRHAGNAPVVLRASLCYSNRLPFTIRWVVSLLPSLVCTIILLHSNKPYSSRRKSFSYLIQSCLISQSAHSTTSSMCVQLPMTEDCLSDLTVLTHKLNYCLNLLVRHMTRRI